MQPVRDETLFWQRFDMISPVFSHNLHLFFPKKFETSHEYEDRVEEALADLVIVNSTQARQSSSCNVA